MLSMFPQAARDQLQLPHVEWVRVLEHLGVRGLLHHPGKSPQGFPQRLGKLEILENKNGHGKIMQKSWNMKN